MAKEDSGLLTPEQAVAWLQEHGMTCQQVADALKVKRSTVYAVLAGKNKGTINDGHKIAVALRIKAKPSSAPPPLIPSADGKPAEQRAGRGRRAADAAAATETQR